MLFGDQVSLRSNFLALTDILYHQEYEITRRSKILTQRTLNRKRKSNQVLSSLRGVAGSLGSSWSTEEVLGAEEDELEAEEDELGGAEDDDDDGWVAGQQLGGRRRRTSSRAEDNGDGDWPLGADAGVGVGAQGGGG